MTCIDDVVMAKLQKRVAELVSLGSITVLLAVFGIIIVLWMAIIGFVDITGLIVGIIFIVLSICQVLFGFVWWRAVNNQSKMYQVQMEEEMKAEPSKLDGSGDGHTLVTDEVKVSYTSSAEKAEATMVKV